MWSCADRVLAHVRFNADKSRPKLTPPMGLISGDEEFSSFTEREKYELERGEGKWKGETIFYLERDTCADRLTEGDRERGREGRITVSETV